jgi:hypothetical protein
MKENCLAKMMVLYASNGTGRKKAAEAIAAALSERAEFVEGVLPVECCQEGFFDGEGYWV